MARPDRGYGDINIRLLRDNGTIDAGGSLLRDIVGGSRL